MTQTNRRSPWGWLSALIIVVLLLVVGLLFLRSTRAQSQASTVQSGTVSTITVVSTVDGSGTVQPRQSAILYWKTTGQVSDVKTAVGDSVKAGDLLMSLDASTMPAQLISAQADLIAAQQSLNNLLQPDQMTLASAQAKVADAYQS